MRLLHTKRLEIEEFTERKSGAVLVHGERDAVPEYAVPRYAILSHTWEEEEVSLQDWQGDLDKTIQMKGYDKIRKSCHLASQDGYDWIWIDTCCIDKTSSTELSEAINSMFKWYQNSAICYVYLSDATGTQPVYRQDDERYQLKPTLARWYSRGWTLQEVIAPTQIRFLRDDWTDVGTKEDHLEDISKATGIDTYALQGGDLSRISVARRLTWLARRETTRIEDMAYCMLGIFDINMPLLYGEGSKAFIRLQEEIIKATEDQSIFVWAESDSLDYYREDYGESFSRYGLVADSPNQFASSASVAMFPWPRPLRPHPVVTRQGLRVHLLMCEDVSYLSGEVFLAVLDCQIGSTPGVLAGIRLRRITENRFVRVDIAQLFRFARCDLNGEVLVEGFDPTTEQKELVDLTFRTSHKNWQMKEVYIAQSALRPLPPGFWVVPSKQQISIENVYPPQFWDTATNILQPHHRPVSSAKIGAIGLRVRGKSIALVLGVFVSYTGVEPWCKLCSYSKEDRLSDVFNAFEFLSQQGATGCPSGKDFSVLTGLSVSVRETAVSSIEMNVVQLDLVEGIDGLADFIVSFK